MLSLLHNTICLVLWSAVVLYVVFALLMDHQLYHFQDSRALAMPIFVMQIVQSLAFLEIIYVLCGITKGNLISTVLQFLGRIVVALLGFHPDNPARLTILVLVPWSMGDIVRYAFYLNRSKVTNFLRYNLFIVLYPFGIFSQMRLINSAIGCYQIQGLVQVMVRVAQLLICSGMPFLFQELWKKRSHYHKTA